MDLETMYLFKRLMQHLQTPHVDCRQDGTHLLPSPRCSYLLNTTISGLEEADFFLLVGTNPRIEAPTLNARIRKAVVDQKKPVISLGDPVDLTYPATFHPVDILNKILQPSDPLHHQIRQAQKPVFILGQGALQQSPDLLKFSCFFAEKMGFIKPNWCGFNVLHTAAARVGALDLGLTPGPGGYAAPQMLEACKRGEIKALFLLGADEIPTDSLSKTFVIYQGHHGDQGACAADVILPGAAYTEKNGLYMNTEGRLQSTQSVHAPPGDAREDWCIMRDLAEVLGLHLPFETLSEVRYSLSTHNPLFKETGIRTPAPWISFHEQNSGILTTRSLTSPITNFYMTDVISRNSKTMAACIHRREDI